MMAGLPLLTLCVWRRRTLRRGRMSGATPSRTWSSTASPVLWAARSCSSTRHHTPPTSRCASGGDGAWRGAGGGCLGRPGRGVAAAATHTPSGPPRPSPHASFTLHTPCPSPPPSSASARRCPTKRFAWVCRVMSGVEDPRGCGRPRPHAAVGAWATRRSSSLRLQRHQVPVALFSPLVFSWGAAWLWYPFGARWVLPGTQALRCYRAACIRDKEPREIQEIGWFRVPAAGFCCWCGRGACLRVFCEVFSLSAVLAIASASVGAHAVRNSCGLYELQLALTDTDVWKVYLFLTNFY